MELLGPLGARAAQETWQGPATTAGTAQRLQQLLERVRLGPGVCRQEASRITPRRRRVESGAGCWPCWLQEGPVSARPVLPTTARSGRLARRDPLFHVHLEGTDVFAMHARLHHPGTWPCMAPWSAYDWQTGAARLIGSIVAGGSAVIFCDACVLARSSPRKCQKGPPSARRCRGCLGGDACTSALQCNCTRMSRCTETRDSPHFRTDTHHCRRMGGDPRSRSNTGKSCTHASSGETMFKMTNATV